MLDDHWLALGFLFVAGLGAGFVNTLAGGGSLLTLPALMLLGLPADIANGTNRVAVIPQALTGLHGFHRAEKLHHAAIPATVLPVVFGAAVGALSASYFPTTYLKPILLGTMVLMAFVLLLRPTLLTPNENTSLSIRERPAGALGLFAAGIYGGFVQGGVGILLLTVLSGVLRYDLVRANGLKLACALTLGLVSVAIFVVRGQIAWVPALTLAAAATIGARVAVRFATRVSPDALRNVVFIGVIAICVGAAIK